MAKELPAPNAPLITAGGVISPVWYQYFVDLERRLKAQEAS